MPDGDLTPARTSSRLPANLSENVPLSMPPAVTGLIKGTTVLDGQVVFRQGSDRVPTLYPDPDMAEQAKSQIPDALAYLKQKLLPAHRIQILTKLGQLSLHSRPRDIAPELFKVVLADYAEDLKDIPPDILDEACRTWRRQPDTKESTWFPAVGKLLAIVKPALEKRRRDLYKLKKIAKVLDAPIPQEPAPKTEEDKAWASNLVKDVTAKLRPGSATPRPRSGRQINPGPDPIEADQADHTRRHQQLMAKMKADGHSTEGLEPGEGPPVPNDTVRDPGTSAVGG